MKKEAPFLTEPRWPILYRNEKFRDRLRLYEYLCKENVNNFSSSLFLHSDNYYVRAKLEDHFQREFSQDEIIDIIKDKTWQHKSFYSDKIKTKERL